MSNLEEENKLIIQDHKYCQFVSKNQTEFNKLKKYLSFKEAGVEFTPAYQNGWNGITYLMSNKGVFMSGLLYKVENFLQKNSIQYSLIDKRIPITKEVPLDLSQQLKAIGMEPRDYQLNAIDAALKNNKGIIRAATGSGKSLMIAMLTAAINKSTTIYVIGLDLLHQFHELFSKVFKEEIGFIGNGICNIQRINIASIWSIGRAIKTDTKNIINDEEIIIDEKDVNEQDCIKIVKMLSDTKVHIIDESHIVTTSTINHIYKKINPEYLYGFSGTPFKNDNTDLLINGVLGEKLIDISASLLIERGVLAQPIIKFVSVPPLHVPTANYQMVYKSYVAENDIRNQLIVKHTKSLIEKKYTPLVLFKQLKHGAVLLKMFHDAGINCKMLDGRNSLEERNEIKKELNDGKIDAILASTIFDIGLDLPKLSALVLGGSGKSYVKVLQRIGRVLRKYPGKTVVAVVDFFDQVKFLKKHSQTRCNIYESEGGFKVIKCHNMK